MRSRSTRLRRAGWLALGACAALLSATPVSGGELPACRYDDLTTRYTDPADWERTLLDTIYRVPDDYVPPDLVRTSQAGLSDSHFVRGLMVDDLRALAEAAAAAGSPIAIQSAYRSYEGQVLTYNDWVAHVGETQARLTSARPGHSEHQLGLAIDFRSPDGPAPWELADWAATPAGGWMSAHAWEYGFVMSYPAGVSPSITCYTYEPWHYRWMGRRLAARVRVSGLTIREYLWEVMGNAVLTDPSATPTPAASPPSPVPSPSEAESPSPGGQSAGPSLPATPAQSADSTAEPAPSGDGPAPDRLLPDAWSAGLALVLAAGLLLYGLRGARRGG